MRYILSLLLVAIISTSDIIDKEQEINEVGEYYDIKLQFLYSLISNFGKVVNISGEYLNKTKDFIRETEIFELIKIAENFITNATDKDRQIIIKGKLLSKEFKNLENSTKIINAANKLYNKYINYLKPNRIIRTPYYPSSHYRSEKEKFYKIYLKVRDTFYRIKFYYGNITSYYEETKEFYDKKIPKNILQNQRQNKLKEKMKAFNKYNQLKKGNMNYEQKKDKIESLLNYMLEKGFITPSQKQSMSEIPKI